MRSSVNLAFAFFAPGIKSRLHRSAKFVMQGSPTGAQGDGVWRTVLVTGSTDGIGGQTARNLAARGWRVFVHGRNAKRAAAALDSVKASSTGPAPQLFLADLSKAADVRRLAAEVSDACEQHGGGLDVLLNNAGVFEAERKEAEDGVELTFAVNVLAPFMLCSLLRPALEQAATSRGRARIVNVSSISHMDGGRRRRGGTVDWDDLESKRDYDAYGSYGLSKLLLIMMTYSLAAGECGVQTSSAAVEAVTLDPGTVNTKMLLAGWGECGIPTNKANDEAWAVTSSEARSGKYYVGRRERRSAEVTYDKESRMKLWEILSQEVAARDSTA